MLKKLTLLLLSVLLAGITNVEATNNKPYTVIVSGQIINKKYGNAISGHKVYIVSSYIKNSGNSYYKEIITDDEGFYMDTIKTSSGKGSIEIYTLDKNNRKVDSVVYYRFFRNTRLDLMVNITIDMPFHTNILKARFKYTQKQGGNRFYFHFIDLTKNDYIISRQWNFGDGTTSQEKNPDHTYQTPGLYRVKLIIEADFNGVLSTNSFSRLILIPEKTYFNIGGQVFAKLFPIDIGKAFLYYQDSIDSFIPVDTVTFDTLGYFIFYNLPYGKYIIKAQPDSASEYYGYMCPTYFGNVTRWQNADLCEINTTGWDYDIHLVDNQSFTEGNGAINGNVLVVDKGLKQFGLFSGENITIYLLDNHNNNITYLYTGKRGNFNFSNLDLGNYSLYPEVTGVNTSEIHVELNDEIPVIDSMIIELSLEGVNSVIPYHKQSNSLLDNIYPNPAQNNSPVLLSVKLKKSQQIGLTLTDFTGRTVYKTQPVLNAGTNKLFLPVDGLPDGVYIVSVNDEQGHTGTGKLVINR